MEYKSVFKQADGTAAEYDTSHTTAFHDEENYTMIEMEFYSDFPLTIDSVVDAKIRLDHYPICDGDIYSVMSLVMSTI